MPTITRRGTRFRAEVRIRGRAISRTFPDRRTAAHWAAEQERVILAGRGSAAIAHGWTLGELIDRYTGDLVKKDRRTTSQRLAWWDAYYGNVRLADITPALIAEGRDKLARGITPRGTKRAGATVNRYLAALAGCLKAATRRYHVMDGRIPTRDVEGECENGTPGRALSIDEQKRLLAACGDRNPELRVAILFAVTTACRRGELDVLTWNDIDLVRGIARFNVTKNGFPRAVPVPPVTVAALVEWRKASGHIGRSRVLVTRADWLYRQFVALADAEGIGKVRWHDLRHTALTSMARAGGTLPELAAVAGHRTLQMVARYQHLAESAPRDAADRAAAALG